MMIPAIRKSVRGEEFSPWLGSYWTLTAGMVSGKELAVDEVTGPFISQTGLETDLPLSWLD